VAARAAPCDTAWRRRLSSFIAAIAESDRVSLVGGTIEIVDTPSNSGRGQKIARCPVCRVAVWSNYAGAGDRFRFVRVGTLDEPDALPPDIHIFTSTKQPWVLLPATMPAVAEYYDRNEFWPGRQPDLSSGMRFLGRLTRARDRARDRRGQGRDT
jgi:hypothetical protein